MSRYINVDVLISDLEYDIKMDQDSLDYEDLSDVNRELIQNDKDIKQNAVHILENTPTVDAVEVKHGHWGNPDLSLAPYVYACSVCGDASRYFSNYCPNCGAKMDERREVTE